MERTIIETKDGSHTISIPGMQVTYHSLHGAIRESSHIFIASGLLHYLSNHRSSGIHILEIGFGTGLNALLTAMEAESREVNIHYTGLDLFPLSVSETATLNYCRSLKQESWQPFFQQIHETAWEVENALLPHFTLLKHKEDLLDFDRIEPIYDIIYFDSFAPAAQPELWTATVFSKLIRSMSCNGILLTYCSKGDVRRAMQTAGFTVEKLAGPPGKREIVRATKGY